MKASGDDDVRACDMRPLGQLVQYITRARGIYPRFDGMIRHKTCDSELPSSIRRACQQLAYSIAGIARFYGCTATRVKRFSGHEHQEFTLFTLLSTVSRSLTHRMPCVMRLLTRLHRGPCRPQKENRWISAHSIVLRPPLNLLMLVQPNAEKDRTSCVEVVALVDPKSLFIPTMPINSQANHTGKCFSVSTSLKARTLYTSRINTSPYL